MVSHILFNHLPILLTIFVKIFFQIISGNTDTETVVSHRLMPTIYGSRIRILPYSVHRRTVCLRVEIKGCLAGGEFVYLFFIYSNP